MDDDDLEHVSTERTDTIDYRTALAPARRITLGDLFDRLRVDSALDIDAWSVIDPTCVVYVLSSGEVVTVLSLNGGDEPSMRSVRRAMKQ